MLSSHSRGSIKNWIDEKGGEVVFFVIRLATVALVGLLVFYGCSVLVREARESDDAWDDFKVRHSCKEVGVLKGELLTTLGVGANGQVAVGVGSTRDKKGWLCSDGITYWR